MVRSPQCLQIYFSVYHDAGTHHWLQGSLLPERRTVWARQEAAGRRASVPGCGRGSNPCRDARVARAALMAPGLLARRSPVETSIHVREGQKRAKPVCFKRAAAPAAVPAAAAPPRRIWAHSASRLGGRFKLLLDAVCHPTELFPLAAHFTHAPSRPHLFGSPAADTPSLPTPLF